MAEVNDPQSRTGTPDSDATHKAGLTARTISVIKALQLITGLVAILLVPLVWAAWSQTVLMVVFACIFGSAGLFAALNYILHRYDPESPGTQA